ncbi:MAG: FadR family transcriptional regulator [Desulfobacteraceae bacterium]|nr:FadR family transcriptional regulator [Desulfobacteraceae bacterium]
MFRKTKQNRIYQDLVEQIEKAILDGKLKAGDKLPSQRELGVIFQTSRGSLREALRVLEQKGLIDIRPGVKGGAIVKAVNTEQVSESLAFLLKHQKVTLDEISEFREGVEGNVASLAAARATKKDILHLRELLSEAEKHLDNGISKWKESVETDKKLHLAVARIAGNSVYLSVVRMVHENIDKYYEQLPVKEINVMEDNYRNLCDIVGALENREQEKAGMLAQEHVRRFHRHMENKEQKKEHKQ